MRVPEELVETLKAEDSFVIASHVNPEGDALGSSIALALALRSLGKSVRVYNADGVPGMYGFLPYSGLVSERVEREVLEDSVLLIVDCNDLERAGLKDGRCRKVLVVDHHQTAGDFGDVRWIEAASPAAGLMVFHLIKSLGLEIDQPMAVNLYTALAVDTGTFRYDNTTAETLRVAAELVEAGADAGEISRRLYESWSMNRFMLLVSALRTLEITEAGGVTVAVTTISRDMFEETGTDGTDTENFTNFPRMVGSVAISAMFREIGGGCWKASLRSRGDCDVSAVALHFGGGGHRNAAGFKACGDIGEIKAEFLEFVRKSFP